MIEYYQRIEDDLEKIYARISDNVVQGFEEVERDSISAIIRKIRNAQLQKNTHIITDEEMRKIEEMCKRRNYWVHNCFLKFPLDDRIKKNTEVNTTQELINDFFEAEKIVEILMSKF
ncbi:MAG: hypothetical protein K5930_13385 [Treponemataceae bacterium]|nr:hypothetical protein [Treponemataceae bacterium]